MPKKDEYVKFKNFERKINPLFMIYANLESILVPEDNEKQNWNESYTNKYQKHIAFCYGYKLEWTDCKFNEPSESCLGEDAVYYLISSMIEENK